LKSKLTQRNVVKLRIQWYGRVLRMGGRGMILRDSKFHMTNK